MPEELNTSENDQKKDNNAFEILDWTSKNAPDYQKEVEEKLNSVNYIIRDTDGAYNGENGVIYLPENANKYVVTHELIHLISHRILYGKYETRKGIKDGDFDTSPNEALTELSTFVMYKGSEYIQNTEYSEIIQEYKRMSPAEPGYLYATQFVIKKIKEKNLDSKNINELISTFLFKEGIASTVKKDIGSMLGIEDMDREIKEFQNMVGQKLLKSVWKNFKEMSISDRWENFKVPFGDKEITLGELFRPFESAVNEERFRIYWSIDSNEEEFLTKMLALAGSQNDVSLTSIDGTFLYILLKKKNAPQTIKTLREYFLRKALDLYKAQNNKRKE